MRNQGFFCPLIKNLTPCRYFNWTDCDYNWHDAAFGFEPKTTGVNRSMTNPVFLLVHLLHLRL